MAITSSIPTHARTGVVLLVDHDREMAEMYAEHLATRGYAANHVRTANDGLEVARRIRPDAVVTAMMFPSPIDGLELTRRLRCDPSTKNTRIIVLTGRAFNTDREAAQRAGCDLFLTKPCDPVSLATEVQRLLQAGARNAKRLSDERASSSLVWSKRGEVACPEHAPTRDSTRWTSEGWVGLPTRALHGRVRYQCQHCAGSPIAHDSRTYYQQRIARMQKVEGDGSHGTPNTIDSAADRPQLGYLQRAGSGVVGT